MSVVNVSSASALKSALASAKGGDTIKLAAGNYGTFTTTAKFASAVTITSADADNPAVFTRITLKDASNVTLDDLKFVGDGMGNGVYANGATNVTVKNSDFSKLQFGLGVSNSTNTVITGNHFTKLWHDAMRFSNDDGVTITKNVYVESGSESGYNHKDFIQFWTTSTNASKNILIDSNEFYTTDPLTHGIFMLDESGTKAYENVTISNNYLSSNQTHGVTVAAGKGLTISNNTLVDSVSSGSTPAINVSPSSTNVKIVNNTAPGLPDLGNTSWTMTGNSETGTRVWQFTNGESGTAVANSGGTAGSTTQPGVATATDHASPVGNGTADTFAYSGANFSGEKTVTLSHVDFAEGDQIIFRQFSAGTLMDKNGGNIVWNDAEGTYVKIDSITDLQELDAFSPAITTKVSGDDLLFTITQNTGATTYVIEDHGHAFTATYDSHLF